MRRLLFLPILVVATGAAPAQTGRTPNPAAAARPQGPLAGKPAAPMPTAQAGPPAGAVGLAAAIPDGPDKDAIRRILLKPYAEATGTVLADAGQDGGTPDGTIAQGTDLALLTGAQVQAGCHGNTLSRIDWNALGRDRFLPQAVTDCGAGAFLTATALAWDRDRVQQTPSWSDFWDVARYPGRRGLFHGARGNLEIALLADGVAAGDVYKTLRTPDGLDRAFRKLDQLKPYIVWWDKPDQPAQLLTTGKVLFTATPVAPMARAAVQHHIGLQWQGSLTETRFWSIPHNPPHPQAAAAALIIATDMARQALFAEATGFGPSTRAGTGLLPGHVLADSPSSPANQKSALVVDDGFWAENQDKLDARFAAWAAK